MAQGALGVAGELIGSRYGQGAANTTTQLAGAAAQGLFLLPNSRTQESDADVVGQRLLAQAGLAPRAVANRCQNKHGAGGSPPPHWLSTTTDPPGPSSDPQFCASGPLATSTPPPQTPPTPPRTT